MASIPRNYHNKLQRNDLLAPDDPSRITAQSAVLQEIPITQKFNDPRSPLLSLIKEEQLQLALRA